MSGSLHPDWLAMGVALPLEDVQGFIDCTESKASG